MAKKKKKVTKRKSTKKKSTKNRAASKKVTKRKASRTKVARTKVAKKKFAKKKMVPTKRKASRSKADRHYAHDPGDTSDVTVGLTKLTKRKWQRLRKLAVDPETLEDTYEKWTETLRARRASCEAKGYRIVDKPLDVSALTRWLEERGLANTAKARARFALEQTLNAEDH